MKIQLINAPVEEGTEGVGNVECFPPTGLVSLATHAIKQNPDLEIEILDGGILGIDEIVKRINADLVGVSTLGPTYGSALKILRSAKEKGAVTLVGGHHTYFLAEEILKNRREVDYVLRGDNAELGFSEFIGLLKGEIDKPDEVSSLAYRRDGEVKVNNIFQLSLPETPIIDRSLVPNPDIYYRNYNEHFGKWHSGKTIKNAVTKNAQGCRRGVTGRCVYCNIPDMNFRYRTPEQFWGEIQYLQEDYGINFVFETADSLASFANLPYGNSHYLEALTKARPDDLESELFVFARAEEINPSTVTYFKNIGVKRVNMGLDAGDDQMLRSGLSKGQTTLQDNWRAVRLLHESDIQMYISFVLGGIGETKKSLSNTLRFASDLLEYDHVVVVDPSPLLPLPGSPSWQLVKNRFAGQDLIDTEEAARYWTETVCDVDFDTLIAFNNEIKKVAKSKDRVVGGYGIKNI